MQKIFYTFLFLTLLITSSFAEETFLSLKKNKVNVRYGPSFDSDIKYVYKNNYFFFFCLRIFSVPSFFLDSFPIRSFVSTS